jgi:hypothetical protein
MTGTAPTTRLTVFISDSDRWVHHSLAHEILRRARTDQLTGAVLLRGIEGYGAGRVIHTDRLLSMTMDMPVVIVIVDTHDKIQDFLPHLDEVISDGLVTIDQIQAV